MLLYWHFKRHSVGYRVRLLPCTSLLTIDSEPRALCPVASIDEGLSMSVALSWSRSVAEAEHSCVFHRNRKTRKGSMLVPARQFS